MCNHEQVRQAFEDGSVFGADDGKLDSYLKTLASGPVAHAMEVMANRCSIIRTIKTDRYIKKANRQNTIHTYIIFVLTVLAIAVSGISVYLSVKQNSEATQQIERLVELQREQVKLLKQ